MKYEGRGNFRLSDYSGLIIKDNYFNQFGSDIGGNSIDFCVNILGMNFYKAVKELLSFKDRDREYPPAAKGVVRTGLEKKNIIDENRIFTLPAKSSNNNRVVSYLTKTRGLPESLINYLIENELLYQDKRGNCVFPCYDQNGQAKGAILRGTLPDKPFKGRAKNSDVKFGWSLLRKKRTEEVIVCEAPIDALSLVVLYRDKVKNKCILALGGLFVEALKQFLESYSNIEKIILAVDNDAPAGEFIDKVRTKLGFDYEIKELRPQNHKDWNAVLLAK